jgi:hypothetical protein
VFKGSLPDAWLSKCPHRQGKFNCHLAVSLEGPVSTNCNNDNDVNNQQDATTFSFINLFKSAQHVPGDKFAHPQEHVLTVYTAFGTMLRHCCRPVPRFNCGPIGSSVGALYQKLYIESKCAPEDGRIYSPKHVGLI